jgi:tetratricopeptide (TPR) repeat protein
MAWLMLFAGCAAAPTGRGTAATASGGINGPTEVVATTYVSSTEAGTIAELFDQAKTLLVGGSFQQAAAAFDRIVALEPAGPFAPAALFNAGLSYDQLEARPAALERFQQLARRFPEAPETRHALVRTLRIHAWHEAWAELSHTAELLLLRAGLTPAEKIEAHGSRALGAAELGELDTALLHVSKARTLIEDERLDGGGRLPIGAAPAFFALGEVRRLKGERITFVPVPPDFAQVLEERCQLLLDAQDAYAQAMRTYDAHWAAMAGYRVGQLYQQLHKDVLAIPPTAAKSDKQKELFEGAMRLRYRVLLEKGALMMERTLQMAERSGEQSSWVSRARDAKADLARAFEQEKEALAKLPYSEADLRRALDDLAKKHAGPKP